MTEIHWVLYVFMVIEYGLRHLVHVNVTANPTADLALEQLRKVVGEGSAYWYLIHDGDIRQASE